MKSLPQAILDEQIKNTAYRCLCGGKTKDALAGEMPLARKTAGKLGVSKVAVRKWRYGDTRIILKVKQVRKDSRITRELSINCENGQDEPFYTF